MKVPQNHCVKVLATGLIVLILLSLSLFWARWFCKALLGDIMPMDYRTVDITISGLVPSEIESDPNVLRHSMVHAHIIHPEAPMTLGFVDYIISNSPEGKHSEIKFLKYDEGQEWHWIYFNRKTGQIICRYKTYEQMPDKTTMPNMIQIYIGPEGIAEIPDTKTGRFISPLIDVSEIGMGRLTLYDKKLRQFFAVRFRKEVEFIKGPQLPEDDTRQPIDIGILSKNPSILDLCWTPMYLLKSESSHNGKYFSRDFRGPIRETDSDYHPDKYLLVLDKSGQIDLLDKATLELSGPAGFLPTPKILFPTDETIISDYLLAYRVIPLALKEDHKYRGLFAATVSREGTALALAVFDEKGKCIESKETRVRDGRRGSISSSRAVLFGFPWAPAITVSKFLLENLHPPILSLASYFTANSFEAGSGHRALFLLPNSFIAMKGRDVGENITVKFKFLYALLLISPSIILAILLAIRVGKDTTVVGLSRKTRRGWLFGTIAFGLVGYITYRLTRPKITLVTCANCGKPRRPDMETCHRCGSKWDVPELTPPKWRVLNGAE